MVIEYLSAGKKHSKYSLTNFINPSNNNNLGLEVEKHSPSCNRLVDALHYGAAKFGINSQFYRISSVILNSMRRWKVELMENQITVQTQYPIKNRTFQLNNKEVVFLRSFLPPIACES